MSEALSESRRIRCVEGDLTQMEVDAIVNAANASLRGGGGVDGAIHRAAGPGLLRECIERYPDGCETGEARITRAYDLPARFVIHTPGPIYGSHARHEAELLASCHRESLQLARENDCARIAFPAISCGVYGYPPEEAAAIAIATCATELAESPSITELRFVLFGQEMFEVWQRALDAYRA